MKTFKKVLASTLAAAMVVTALPVTPANAAAKPKLSTTKAAVYVGQSKTIKVTTPKTWKSVKVKATTSKKSVATVKASKKKITVKAIKAGTAKVTVKVTGKKSGKAVKKALKATITVKNPALSVSAAGEVAVGSTEAIKATVKPAKTKVTYTTSDEKIATVDAKGVVTGVAAGDVTITVKAGKTTKTVNMTVKKAILKSATQTEYNKIEAVIVGDTKDLKAGDFKVTNTATNGTVAVKAVTAKKNVADTFVIETFTGMTDAKDYAVEYAGSKATFTATNGTVAKVGVTPVEVAAAEKTPVSLTTIDANGVVLGYTALNNTDTSKGKVTAKTTYAKGYTDGTNVYLPTVGDTMKVDVTYHSGTFGTDGKETGNIDGSFTITAVDPALINLNYAVSIAESTTPDATSLPWKADSFKADNKVKLTVNDLNAFFYITKEDGTQISNYDDYKVESADKTKLLVTENKMSDTLADGSKASFGTTGIAVKGVSVGTTYILVKKNGATVASLPIEVVAAPVATTLDLDKTSISVMQNVSAVSEAATFTIKDQYGAPMTADSSKYEVVGKPSKASKPSFSAITNNKTFTATGSDFGITDDDLGTYTVKISAKKGNVELSRALTINLVKSASKATDYEVRFNQATVDTTIGKSAVTPSNYDVTIKTVRKANGAAIDYVSNGVQYTIKNADGKVVYNNGTVSGASITTDATVVTGAAFTTVGALASNTLTVKTVSLKTGTSSTYDKNLAAGTYYVTAKFKGDDGKMVTVGSTFTVKDTQASKASFLIKNNALGTSTTVASAFEGATDANLQKYVQVFYDGLEQKFTSGDVKKVVGVTLASGGAYIKTVTLYVTVSGSDNKVPVTLNVNDQFASCSTSGIAAN